MNREPRLKAVSQHWSRGCQLQRNNRTLARGNSLFLSNRYDHAREPEIEIGKHEGIEHNSGDGVDRYADSRDKYYGPKHSPVLRTSISRDLERRDSDAEINREMRDQSLHSELDRVFEVTVICREGIEAGAYR